MYTPKRRGKAPTRPRACSFASWRAAHSHDQAVARHATTCEQREHLAAGRNRHAHEGTGGPMRLGKLVAKRMRLHAVSERRPSSQQRDRPQRARRRRRRAHLGRHDHCGCLSIIGKMGERRRERQLKLAARPEVFVQEPRRSLREAKSQVFPPVGRACFVGN